MSEWSYYDKRDVVDNTKAAAKGVADTQREIKSLRDEVKALREEQRELLRVNRQLLEAFNRMAQDVARMREEMYPNEKTPKRGLKRPAAANPAKKS